MTTLKVGDVIRGKYELLEKLGSGSMGVVFKARHIDLGLIVAIKVINSNLVASPEMQKRFFQEARIGAIIQHEGVVFVMDIDSTPEGTAFIVMEYLEGKDLERIIKENNYILETKLALDIITQILTALKEVHEKGYVHRDIKPENVFVIRKTGRVKIMDFGIAKAMRVAQSITQMTTPGTTLGTPYYMSPEQARGMKDLDHRTDIWTVGILLYEMLTGALPFSGNDHFGIIDKILLGKFIPPRDINQTIPERLSEIILKAMTHDREERYQNSEAFLADLRQLGGCSETSPVLLDGDEESRMGDNDKEEAELFLRNRRYPFLVAAAAVLVLGGVVGWFLLSDLTCGTNRPLPPAVLPSDARTKTVESQPVPPAKLSPSPTKVEPPTVEIQADAAPLPPEPPKAPAKRPPPRKNGGSKLPTKQKQRPDPWLSPSKRRPGVWLD